MQSDKFYKLMFTSVLFILTSLIIYYILKFNNIENIFRYILIIMLIIIGLVLFFKLIKNNISFTKGVLLCFYFLILMISISNLKNIYYKLDSITTSSYVSANCIIKMKKGNIKLKSKIGILVDNINLFSNNYLFEPKVFDDYNSILKELYAGNIDYAYVPSNYIEMFQNYKEFNKIKEETETIYTSYKKQKIEDKNINFKEDAFSLLIMGIDSEEDGVIEKPANGDALILITFNPQNMHTTILSIPRDTYTSITCLNKKSKITHASWYGDECMINSIENLFDIDINYFIKINFKGLVNLIDLIGGIDIDVPISFCEQDSNRNYENSICLNKGKQHLNGEETLALARHRKTINDFIRGDNQKLIIMAIVDKLKNNIDIDLLNNVLNEISKNIITNIKIDDILSLYEVVKKIKNINIDDILYKLKLDGYDATIYDKEMKMDLYNFVPYNESIKELSNIMKQNLNSEDSNENNQDLSVILLPKFETALEAEHFCNLYHIKYRINYVDGSNEGMVVNQSIPENIDIDYIDDELVLDVVKNEEKINCLIDKENSKCLIPNFVGVEYDKYKKWLKENNYSFIIVEEKIKSNDKKYDQNKAGLIIDQNISNIYISELIGKKLKIKYIEK